MKRKILLQVLLSMALVLSLILPASLLNTASVMAQGTVTPMVAAGPEIQLAKWDLVESFENGGATGVNLNTALYLVYQADLSDVEPGMEDEIMEGVKGVIERRIAALGITESVITIQEQGGEWSIAIQLPGTADIEKAKEMVVLFTVLEFREQDAAGNWTPVEGTVNGEELTLTSRYFQENTYVAVDSYGKPLLIFEWDETGAQLSKQITTRLLGKQLAIYLGDEPLRGEDGHIIAPVVEAVIEDKGQIGGLSLADAHELRDLLNAGRIDVPLGRWVEEGQSKVFEPNIPLYEGQVTPTAGDAGVKAGDWIKMDCKISGWPAGQPYPEWFNLEFLSVEDTSANVRTTTRWSDGTEQSDTMPVDLAAGGGDAFIFSGLVISANLTTGDSVYMSGFGDVAIEGETTRTYTGARRTVVYASISESIPYQGDIQLTYYWDKLTGVMVEASATYAGMTLAAKATETNMWEATTVGMPWWPWIIVAVVAAGLVVFFMRRRRRSPADTSE